MTTLVLVVLAYQLNATMVSPSLPDMARALDVGVDSISLVTSCFFLTGAIGGVVLSRWSDHVGRRTALLVVLGLLAVGTIVCVFAPSLPWMLAGRLLQGTAAASFQLVYLILHERVGAKAFGVALGIITACNGGVIGLDGYLGGLLTAEFGFRASFVVILAVVALAVVGTLLAVPADAGPPSAGRMDWWGAAVLSVCLVAASQFVSVGSAVGWLAPGSLALAAVVLVGFAGFVVIERRRSAPLVAVRHLRSGSFWPVLLSTGLSLAGLFSVVNFTIMVLSQDPAVGFGLPPALAAICFLTPAALVALVAAPLAGWLAERFGWVRILRIGLAVSVAALAVAAMLPTVFPVVFTVAAVLGATYNGIVLTTVNGLGVVRSPADAPAALPALNSAAFGLGVSVGVTLVAPHVGAGTAEGFSAAFWIAAAVTALALVSTLLIAAVPASPPAPSRMTSGAASPTANTQ